MTEIPTASRLRATAPRRSARSPFAWGPLIALVLSLLLAACGPGTGGTGTGPDAGASAGPGGSLVAGGDLLGNWRGGDVLAVFEPQRIRVQQGCQVFGYEGPWSLDPLRGVNLTVRLEGAAASTGAGGAVSLQIVPIDAERIRIIVRDARGVDLIGPLEARRSGAAPALNEPGC